MTAVAKGSPADSVLHAGDVILGVDGRNFAGDARILFAGAIATAESGKGGGSLRLIRWRNGQPRNVVLKLSVLGSYSDTAPYHCPKSKRIFQQGCLALAKRMTTPDYLRNLDPIPRSLNALALLASGNSRYLPLVRREARWAADFSTESFATWYYGYVMTLVAEYVMRTRDNSLMPGLKRLAMKPPTARVAWAHGDTSSPCQTGT